MEAVRRPSSPPPGTRAAELDDVTARLAADVTDQGWCIVEDVVPAQDLPAVRDVVLREERLQARARASTWTRTSNGSVDGSGHQGMTKATAVVAKLGARGSFIAECRLLGAVRRLLGGYVRVSSDFGIVTRPGTAREFWHCDWPYNQTMAAHVPEPYGDLLLHLSALFMLTDFTAENGGTLIVPGSHRWPRNPTGGSHAEAAAAHPQEQQVVGRAGSVLLYDARLWHSVAPNRSAQTRLALAVRYAPWWLNLEVRRPGSAEARLVQELMQGRASHAPELSASEYEALPAEVRALYEHWLRR